ncbi:hypothetical protein [Zavarzinia sp. CC-PAN008]|uniref:hypothetical protein n=1 Tax=Zavarzinia sp. CC-PAN008 TaxID=3243332 RepID=UPI003F74ACBA
MVTTIVPDADLEPLRRTLEAAEAQAAASAASLNRSLSLAPDTAGLDRLGARLEQLDSAAGLASRSLSRSLAGALNGVETDWSRVLSRLSQDLVAFFLRANVVAPLLRGLTAGLGGGGGGLLGAGISGFLADGGPALPGRAYVVGERGPELFVPRAAGTVVPNGAATGATVNVTIHTPDIGGFNRARSQVQAEIARAVAAGRRTL